MVTLCFYLVYFVLLWSVFVSEKKEEEEKTVQVIRIHRYSTFPHICAHLLAPPAKPVNRGVCQDVRQFLHCMCRTLCLSNGSPSSLTAVIESTSLHCSLSASEPSITALSIMFFLPILEESDVVWCRVQKTLQELATENPPPLFFFFARVNYPCLIRRDLVN